MHSHSYPPFLAYFSKPPGLLVISANKCASTFLDTFLIGKKGFNGLAITDESSNELLTDTKLYEIIYIFWTDLSIKRFLFIGILLIDL